MEDVEVLCRFGTPLEPLEEDEIPSKKPILIEDQIVTDENGRRRFHGAFTGGFSAGFWNTVGSLEGWTPKEFKSSRDEKFKIQQQKPTDFMDDEDFGEFGFAPQRIQTTADFTSKKEVNEDNSKKRKHNKNKDGPIPGIPVLQQLLEPSKDNIAIRLLKKMGWKEGQGIGARQTKSEKKSSAKHNFKEQYILKKYGCDMGPIAKADSIKSNSDSESDISDIDGITFAPDDFEPYICAAKDNCFGLGYVGLSREPVLKQHINLFGPLELLDNNKQKLSIRGKGFGVGALEEEDEDIYHHDDLSNYDFSLDKPSNQKHKPIPKPQDFHIIDGFSGINETNIHTKKVFVVKIPPHFTPRNWLFRKSRFEPLDEKRAAILKQQDEVKIKGLGRHDITLDERKEILEGTSKKSKNEMINNDSPIEKEKGNKKQKTYLEKINEKYKIEDNKKDKVLNMLVAKSDNFVKSEIIKEDGTILKEGSSILSIEVQTENENIINEAKKITKYMDTNSCGSFKPFLADSAKQERYEKYLSKHFSSDEEITNFLRSIQPSNMSEWDRQMEKKEFEQAKKMYKPLKGIMSDRFVTESAATVERETKKTDPDRKGKTIRTKNIWHPVSLLCKRFNIAEPFINLIKEEKNSIVKPKLSVFDYLEASVNNKETFVTPIVIPKNEEIEKSSELNSQSENLKRLSAKDMFTKEVNANKNSKSQEKVISTEINKSIENKEVNNVEITKEQSIKSDKTDKKIIKQKPKTELELKIEELKNKHPSEKKDLYKTVFVSSSESEDDTIDNKDKKNTETGEIISKQNNETLEMTNNTKDLNIVFNKPASEINILRNTSPPRGIFAAFFKDTEIPNKSQGFEIEHSDIKTESENPFKNSECDTNKKIKFKSQSERNLKVSPLNNLSSSDIYGPIIPSNINSSFSITQTTKFKNSISNTDGQLHIDSKLQNLIEKHKTKTKIIEEWVEVTSNNSSSKKNKKDKKKKKKNEKSKHRSRSSSTSSRSSNSSKSSNSNRNNINHSHRSKKKSKKSKKNKKHRK